MKKTMKRLLAMMLVVVMTIGAAPLSGFVGLDLPEFGGFRKLDDSMSELFDGFAKKAEAAEYTSGNYKYNFNGDGDAVITGVNKSISGNVTIPSMIDGYTVVGLSFLSFENCDKITSVIIPDSITEIGYGVFRGCNNLVKVTLPSSIDEIVQSTFECCTSLSNIIIPESVKTIGESAFNDCDSLASITIPDSVMCIGKYAFDDCDSLTSVEIGDSVTSIGYGAFDGCSSLTSIIIPDSVTSIGDSAFGFCKSLTSIEIPDSVTSIGNYAFKYCSSLANVTIPDGVTSIGDGAFEYCHSLTSIIIPDSVTSIGECAFEYCKSLTSITIPDSVTSIGGSAFHYCTSLTSVSIGNSVTSIGDYAFFYCSGLTSITVDSANTAYSSDEYGVLFNKDKTELIQYPNGNIRTSYKIPDSVTSIGYGAFEYCTSLTSVTIGNGVTRIGDYAFAYSSLTSVTIGNSVTSIGGSAFRDCTSLTSVTIGNSVTRIGDVAFGGCTSLTSVTIPDSVTSIGEGTFYECNSLTSVTIDNGVTYITKDMFFACDSLTSVTIPDSVTSIGYGAFAFCPSLTSVTIPDSVTSIGDRAFYNCDGLTSVTIGNCVTSIGDEAFHSCDSLTDVYYTGTEAQWNAISIGSDNEDLTNATIHYNYVPEGGEIPDPEGKLSVVSITPANGSAGVSFNDDLVITFDEDISNIIKTYGEDGIEVRDYSSDTPLFVFDDDYASYDIIGNKLILRNALKDIESSQKCYVYIPQGAVSAKDDAGVFFEGIHNKNVWSFTIKDSFVAERDGWCILNNNICFGYPQGYRIDYTRYTEVFTEKTASRVYNIKDGKWGGNCFGLSLLAIMHQQKNYNFKKYFLNSKSGLNNFGYDVFNKEDSFPYKLTPDSNVIKLIEKAQLLQHSKLLADCRVFRSENSVEALLDYVMNNNSHPLLICVKKENVLNYWAHALVLETNKAYTKEDGIYYIPVYDCNAPQVSVTNKNMALGYNQKQYILIDPINKSWRLAYDPQNVSKKWYNSEIELYDVTNIDGSVLSTRQEGKSRIEFIIGCNGASADISAKGNKLFSVSNGQVIQYDDDCEFFSEIDCSLKLNRKYEELEVENAANSMVTIENTDQFIGVCVDNNLPYKIILEKNDENVSGVKLNVVPGTEYTIVLQNSKGEDFSTVNISGESLTDNTIIVNIDSDGNIFTDCDEADEEVNISYFCDEISGEEIKSTIKLGDLNGKNTTELAKEVKENQSSFSATCSYCGQIFTDETAYNNHLETHKKISVSVISGMVIGGELKLGATITIKAEQIDGKVFKQWVAEGAKVADKNSAETTAVIEAREITITAEYDDCECKCHKGGITAFFFKIVLFFQKLFGKNAECPCGAKH